ncbi:hypothetical protein FAZ78_17935 [Cereibacter changlensis]|uniref:Uncharacterized protein n=1 Tax=Cereibacter changlensis TaxID=402884 RepID=A0A4U0YX84_9RHOB|nr:hypothetical protein [Cereibacter changlensis]TKA95236.1 hypothetical protein FAZ78_17935 [Cereibacter changlensis]
MMRYSGFYWTLPVFWAGFRKLDPDAAVAASQSRTIRYQRELIKQWIRRAGGTLVRETVAMEAAPDRASGAILVDLEKALTHAMKDQARLVLVDFAEAQGWRRHGPLWQRLAEEDVEVLSPAPLVIDNEAFDPRDHFRAWREIEVAHVRSKPEHRTLILAAVSEMADLSVAARAEALNGAGLRSFTGRLWSEDNLRKFLSM